MKGKNKLVPRLLGITKESVMRVDEKTKDMVQDWPLTTVKRWAASPKSFTLVPCDSPHLVRSSVDATHLYNSCAHNQLSHIQSLPRFFISEHKQHPKIG